MTSRARDILAEIRYGLKRVIPAIGLSILIAGNGLPVAARSTPAVACPVVLDSDAARFLEQATFGPMFATDPSDPNYPVSVAHVQDLGIEGWLMEQFNMPVLYPDDQTIPQLGTNYPSPGDPGTCDDIKDGAGMVIGGGGLCWSAGAAPNTCTDTGPSTCRRDNYTAYLLQLSFFTNALSGPDQLRQRIAWSLSQIDVVSELTIGQASWMTPYVQLFDRDAFGNFRDLLYDISVNPAMGEYLNMRGNTRQNVNENYAREILQLFSVGLNLLNPDGTPAISGDCAVAPCPTYTQDTITNFARVFTSWNLQTQIPPNIPNYRDIMWPVNEVNNHDQNPKTLLDYPDAVNRDLPGTDGAVNELNEAIDNIFNHPNIGPFIGRLLIQKLVTSNPSPDYVARVTAAFNTGTYTGNNTFGSGVRGDMQAVIAAILLDAEARTAPGDPYYGHLREPVLFVTNTLRALGIDPAGSTSDFVLGDQFLPSGATHNLRMDQDVFRPPTVFSYYPPDNQLILPDATVFAPEYGIQSTSTALSRINFVRDIAFHNMPTSAKDRPIGTWVDTTPFEPESAGDASALLDDLNARLMHGTMTDALRSLVQNAVTGISEADATGRVQEAIYLIASSSEYQVQR